MTCGEQCGGGGGDGEIYEVILVTWVDHINFLFCFAVVNLDEF